jgi:repressor LexA
VPRESNLSEEEQVVLDYLAGCFASRGEFPSVSELCVALDDEICARLPTIVTSLRQKRILNRCGDKLLLPWLGPRHRARYAVAGHIPGGLADSTTPTTEDNINIDLSALGIKTTAHTFLLRVRGNSMEGAGIRDGDTVVVDKRTPRIGDIVAALIDHETTLKRLVEKHGLHYLQAENPAYPDLIPIEELTVQGVVIGHIRPVP